METVEILKIDKSLPEETFCNLAIPISYILNKKKHTNVPNFLYTNYNNELSDKKIDDLINLVNINTSIKKSKQKSKKKILESKKSKIETRKNKK